MSAEPSAPRSGDVLRACHGKKRYGSEETANAVAADCYRERGTWLRVYACSSCGGYHLTKTNAGPEDPSRWREPRVSQRALAERAKRERRPNRRGR